MRISVDPSDRGYTPTWTHVAAVRLNGVTQAHAITADDQKGELHRYMVDPKTGKVQLNSRGEMMTEYCYGHVTIELAPPRVDLADLVAKQQPSHSRCSVCHCNAEDIARMHGYINLCKGCGIFSAWRGGNG